MLAGHASENKIQQLAQSLEDIGKHLTEKEDSSDPWFLVWLLLVGACYGLHRAFPFLTEPVDKRKKFTETMALLDGLSSQIGLDEHSFANWAVGYHLNSMEVRLQSGLHRLLRTFTGRKVDAFPLIREIMRYPRLQSLAPNTHEIFVDFLATKSTNPLSPGQCLRRVWDRVNDLKHDPIHSGKARHEREARWLDACAALESVLEAYAELARIRKALR